jgi:hypothetical protein
LRARNRWPLATREAARPRNSPPLTFASEISQENAARRVGILASTQKQDVCAKVRPTGEDAVNLVPVPADLDVRFR